MGLPCSKYCIILTSTVFIGFTRVMDRQTDGRAIAYSALSTCYMLSRAKNRTTSQNSDIMHFVTVAYINSQGRFIYVFVLPRLSPISHPIYHLLYYVCILSSVANVIMLINLFYFLEGKKKLRPCNLQRPPKIMQKLCRTYCVLNNKYTVKFCNSSIKPSNQYTCNYFIVSLRYIAAAFCLYTGRGSASASCLSTLPSVFLCP